MQLFEEPLANRPVGPSEEFAKQKDAPAPKEEACFHCPQAPLKKEGGK